MADGFESTLAREAAALSTVHGLDAANATLISAAAAASLLPSVRRLLSGRSVRLFVVGGSAAAGAGGIGVNRTFDARLVTKLNAVLAKAEAASSRPLGRVVRTNVAQGGTTSFWAALMSEALHGRLPHLLVWEYSINDHAVSLEAASRAPSGKRGSHSVETMRYLLDYWLRRSLAASGGPPPALLLTYLWDKQPAAAFKAGNRALCRRMPVPGTAYAAQRPVLDSFASGGAGLAALDMAGYISRSRSGRFCPLVADSYYHPSDEGHELVADLLSLMLVRMMRTAALGGGDDASAGKRAALQLPPPRALPRLQAGSSVATPITSANRPPLLEDGVSDRLDSLLADGRISPLVALAWEPKRKAVAAGRLTGAGGRTPAADGAMQAEEEPRPVARPYFTGGGLPPTRLFAKSVKERADRKWMWLVPPCKADNSSGLSVWLPSSPAGSFAARSSGGGGGAAAAAAGAATGAAGRHIPLSRVRAISYFAMESPGAKIRHTLDGHPLRFDAVKGSFLAQSWGYLQQWHVLDDEAMPPSAASEGRILSATAAGGRRLHKRGGGGGGGGAGGGGVGGAREWRLCAEHVPNARCVGFRCGLEFKMPMKTAAVGWFLTLSSA